MLTPSDTALELFILNFSISTLDRTCYCTVTQGNIFVATFFPAKGSLLGCSHATVCILCICWFSSQLQVCLYVHRNRYPLGVQFSPLINEFRTHRFDPSQVRMASRYFKSLSVALERRTSLVHGGYVQPPHTSKYLQMWPEGAFSNVLDLQIQLSMGFSIHWGSPTDTKGQLWHLSKRQFWDRAGYFRILFYQQNTRTLVPAIQQNCILPKTLKSFYSLG